MALLAKVTKVAVFSLSFTFLRVNWKWWQVSQDPSVLLLKKCLNIKLEVKDFKREGWKYNWKVVWKSRSALL